MTTKPDLLLTKAQIQLDNLQKAIPQLKSLEQKPADQPTITYYEGKEGYLVAAEDSLKVPSSIIRHIGSLAELHKIIGLTYDINHYTPERVKKNIQFKALYFKSEVPEIIIKRDHLKELREIRFLPETYLYKTSMLIYGKKIAIFSGAKELITVIIESKAISESERQKFDLIWDLAGKNDL